VKSGMLAPTIRGDCKREFTEVLAIILDPRQYSIEVLDVMKGLLSAIMSSRLPRFRIMLRSRAGLRPLGPVEVILSIVVQNSLEFGTKNEVGLKPEQISKHIRKSTRGGS
jgi:hypothetical protein